MKIKPDEMTDKEYNSLMENLDQELGCKCGIPHCPGHEVVDGKVIVENHPASKGA